MNGITTWTRDAMQTSKALAATCSLLAVLAAAGCQTSDSSGGGSGSLSVNVSALTAAEVGDACYGLRATDGSGDTLWTQSPVCASGYGADASISYIGVCDGNDPTTTVTLELLSLADEDGNAIPDSEYVNPCPAGTSTCEQTVTCEENGDVPVDFDLVVMLDADQGFVDVAVDVSFLACSGKLDCTDGEGAPLEFLHDPATGERGPTVILGFECLSAQCMSPGAYLYNDDVVITCDEGTATISPDGPGAVPFSSTGPDIFAAVVYEGQQSLGTGQYRNLAIGFQGGTNCTLTARATGSDVAFAANASPLNHPHAVWNVPLTDETGALVCSKHGLDTDGSGVATQYPADLAEATFDHQVLMEQPEDCDGCVPTDDIVIDDSVTQEMRVCSKTAGTYNIEGSNAASLREKLQNPVNFGPGGSYGNFAFTFATIGAGFTQADLDAQCDIWFSGYESDGTYDAAEQTALLDWAAAGGQVIAGCDSSTNDAVCELLSAPVITDVDSYGFAFPYPENPLTCSGELDETTQLNMAGGAGAYFDPAALDASFETVAVHETAGAPDAAKPVVVYNGAFFLTSDINMIETGGTEDTVTDGPDVTSPNDILAMNMFSALGSASLGNPVCAAANPCE